ncbi:MAG: TIM-barrel domain-containing protein [Phycisphaerae bacterium]
MKRHVLSMLLVGIVAPLGRGVLLAQAAGAAEIGKVADGIILPEPNGFLKLQVISDDIVRVAYAPDRAFFNHKSFAIAAMHASPAHWDVAADADNKVLTTARLKVVVDAQGTVKFEDLAGKMILGELPGSRTMEPAEVQGQATHHIRQQWLPDPDESLYGLGQHQYGLVDIKGTDIELWQHNTEIAVPFLVSSKGYGLFWDNPSFTKFGDPRPYEAIPTARIFDMSGQPGGFTATPYADEALTQPGPSRVDVEIHNGDPANRGKAKPTPGEKAIVWEGDLLADTTGDYKFQLYANGNYTMWIDGEQVANHWRQDWLPWDDLAHAHFDAGTKHHIKLQWLKDGCEFCTLKWKPPVAGDEAAGDNTSLWSSVGDGIDYYFVYGPSLDRVIHGYRQLTGNAPMMPKWIFGLWQSRQRYVTQQESLDVVKKFRDLQIPFDNIVQDWMYWKEDSWGSHEFDPKRFPDPDGWIKQIHALHAHLMISVWGKFYPSTDNFKALDAKGYLYPVDPNYKDWVGPGYPYTFYDAFNPGARQMFWDQVRDRLFVKGIDAWWMDATEPDLVPSPPTLDRELDHMPKTGAGTGASVQNAYPLLNSAAVYEGQRQAAPDQRVFILTRSGYAGQQHFAAASWSGDISSTWTAMKKQIAAGLGYSISGLPYWTMDSGGFSVPPRFSPYRPMTREATDEWREMNARWFEFATFVPMLRVHGEAPFREMWLFGGEGSPCYNAQLKFDKLRYRMLPYIYSLAGAVTQNDATIMRPLVMDFPNDKRARELSDEYLFGPAFLVSPVTEYKARSRSVYLPEGTWYDFWTGAALDGGRDIDAEAPYNAIPLHIRAGSIIPFGPDLQYTGEKKADPLTLYVYAGRNGDFTLYEDDGLTYQYEKGAFSEIPISWNDANQKLTIGKRQGGYPGMLQKRTIHVVFISKNRPVGYESPADGKTVTYDGAPVELSP